MRTNVMPGTLMTEMLVALDACLFDAFDNACYCLCVGVAVDGVSYERVLLAATPRTAPSFRDIVYTQPQQAAHTSSNNSPASIRSKVQRAASHAPQRTGGLTRLRPGHIHRRRCYIWLHDHCHWSCRYQRHQVCY
jgi:hypothetical protein